MLQTTIPNIGPGALKFKDDDAKTTSQGKVSCQYYWICSVLVVTGKVDSKPFQ